MKKNTRRKRAENWLVRNGHLINITALEREIKTPKGAVQKSMKYGKRLNDERIERLNKIIDRLQKS